MNCRRPNERAGSLAISSSRVGVSATIKRFSRQLFRPDGSVTLTLSPFPGTDAGWP